MVYLQLGELYIYSLATMGEEEFELQMSLLEILKNVN